MSELLSQLIAPPVQWVFIVFLIMVIAIYALVVVWVSRDAFQRGSLWWAWALVSLIPIVGIIAYLLLRPSLMQVDRSEQELEITLKQRELMKYGECANCGYPVESDYIICPNCHTRLKNLCPTCGHALDPSWSVCPYCARPVGQSRRSPNGAQPQARQNRPHNDPAPQMHAPRP